MLWQKNSRDFFFFQKTGFCLKPTFLLLAVLRSGGSGPAPLLEAAPGATSKFEWDFVLVRQKLPKQGELVSSPGPDTCCFYLLRVSGKTWDDTCSAPAWWVKDVRPPAAVQNGLAVIWGKTRTAAAPLSKFYAASLREGYMFLQLLKNQHRTQQPH